MQRGMADSRPGLLMVWALVAAALMINSAIAQGERDEIAPKFDRRLRHLPRTRLLNSSGRISLPQKHYRK